jgi:glycosyltransferase involved in cell wall biosynthesis
VNILIIARADHSGAGMALSEAINSTTEHNARAIAYKGTWLKYPTDMLNPPSVKKSGLIEWADVLNIHDEAHQYIPRTVKKPVVTTYHGSWYRKNWKSVNERDRKRGFRSTCLTIDLAVYGARWIGRAMPDLSHMWQPAKEFTACHAPTQRHRKGTHHVIKGCEKAGVKLELIEKVPNAECLKRKAKCHILLDQVGSKGLGYGTNALEAWSMGMPVMSTAQMPLISAIVRTLGYLPFINIQNVDDIVEFLGVLRDDEEAYEEACEIGQRYVRDFHAPAVVAAKFIKVCEEVL